MVIESIVYDGGANIDAAQCLPAMPTMCVLRYSDTQTNRQTDSQ